MAGDEFLLQLAQILKGTVDKTFAEVGKINFADPPPSMDAKYLIEYNRRMRVSGIDIFNFPCFVTAINFYKSDKDKVARMAAGAVILYVKATASEQILKGAGLRGFDEDDDEAVSLKCSELGKKLAESFQQDLVGQGYPALVLSEPITARNNIAQGIEFSYDQYNTYEIGFVFKKEKILALELTMTKLAR